MDKVLTLKNISKKFSNTQVLKNISLDIYKGEFVTILGSSGCGKTTTLRIIAGLESQDTGDVEINGVNVNNLEPENRQVNTIFQNYALFPHMNVYKNIAYSLKLKKLSKEEIKQRVTTLLDTVMLSGYENRLPSQLSGGEKQRVAIARALANEPSVLLLDEPLGALDLKLRRQMQQELKKLQKKLGITFVYITHDQEEAINMSDRIVIMNNGLLEQIGSPSEIYDKPKTSFVASFIGTTNLFTGTVVNIKNNEALVRLENNETVSIDSSNHNIKIDQKISFSVRSEHIYATKENKEGFTLKAKVSEDTYVGGMLRIVFKINDWEIYSTRQGIHNKIEMNEEVYISWDLDNAWIVDLGLVDDK